MTTWSRTEYLNSAGYTPSTHSSWSQYTVVLVAGDTLNVRTIYNGGNSNATSINYIIEPSFSTTVNDPDPTTSQTGLDRTWSSSGFSNSNHHTRWYWFTGGGVTAQKSVRILTIPSTMGWSGVQANIEQGFSGSAVLTIPSSFEPYIKGTASESGDNLSTNGSKQERFHWRITSSSSSNNVVSVFPTNSGYFAGPSSGDSITISPTTSTPAGTYYLKLYHYSQNGTTAGDATLLDTVSFNVTAAAALDTNISIPTTAFSINDSATSVSGVTMTSGGTNTIYYLLNVSNFTNGSDIDALRSSTHSEHSKYIARTFSSTTGTRTFETIQSSGTITKDLPSVGSFKTYYVYAANGAGTNSTRLTSGSTQVTVGRPDTTISLSPSATSISASSTSDVTVNVTGDTSNTQYRLFSDNIGSYGRWVSSYNGGQSNTTDFTISYDEAADGSAGTGVTELPSAGNTFTYYSQARVSGHSAPYINTGNSFTVSRAAAANYTVSGPSSGSVNEGATLTFTITTSNVTNGTTVPWTLGGTLQSGEYTTSASSPATIQNNSATLNFNITADNVADGNKTATLTLGSTDSAGNSTGGASASITVVDTSNPGGGGGSGSGTGGGSAGTYGLKIQNINGTTTIIDDTSRLTNFLATDSINTNSQSFKDMFMTFDCSDKTETGFLVTWSGAIYSTPSITRHGTTSLTITATTAGTNKVTLTGSTSVLTNGMPVYIASDVGGLYADTLYYVKNKNSSGTSIELSLTNGGSTVALSTTVLTTNPMTQVAMLRAGIRVTKNANDTTSTQSGIAKVELVRY